MAAVMIVVGALGWSAVLGLVTRLVVRHVDPREATPRVAGVTIWFAPATILILQFSMVGVAAGLALVVSAARLLCPPSVRPTIAEYGSLSVISAGELLAGRLARHFALSILISAGFQTAIVAFVMGRRLSATLLLTASTVMLTAMATGIGVWAQDRSPNLPMSIMGLALTVVLALSLVRGGRGSGWALGMGSDWTLSFHSGSGGGEEDTPTPVPAIPKPVSTASVPKRAEDWPQVRPVSAGDVPGMFPGVILWPEIKPVTALVAPSLARGVGLGSPSRPLTIPFAGEYWLFRWPYQRPPPNSYFQRGTPSSLFFSSTDRRPLQMEAHHKLERAISMRCCGRIELAIFNADRHPGTITLELLLIDGNQPHVLQSLGQSPVNSVPDLKADRLEPVAETVDFLFPSAPRIDQFDEIKMIFRRAVERMDKSARISIEKFVLMPLD